MSDDRTKNEDGTVTAGMVVIGDEILSGRTRDTNSGHVAATLTAVGIDLREIRVVPDDQALIVEAVNALRERYTYVFTCGGIGPTHDDITADAIAAAFSVGIDHDPRAVKILQEHYENPADLNEARLRMARIPNGAELIMNPVSKAPGFRIGNVFVMAGVPNVLKAMLDVVVPGLRTGVRTASRSIVAGHAEGMVGGPLAKLQAAFPDVAIGSYPAYDPARGYFTTIVLRSRDERRLDEAEAGVLAMLDALAGDHPPPKGRHDER